MKKCLDLGFENVISVLNTLVYLGIKRKTSILPRSATRYQIQEIDRFDRYRDIYFRDING